MRTQEKGDRRTAVDEFRHEGAKYEYDANGDPNELSITKLVGERNSRPIAEPTEHCARLVLSRESWDEVDEFRH